MPKRSSHKVGSELFIVDNSAEDWKALRYLKDWCELSKGLDIASGFFEVGALLALDGEWQKLEKVRILMGDEVSRRTRLSTDPLFDALVVQRSRSYVKESMKREGDGDVDSLAPI